MKLDLIHHMVTLSDTVLLPLNMRATVVDILLMSFSTG